jgi:hypothetical protein
MSAAWKAQVFHSRMAEAQVKAARREAVDRILARCEADWVLATLAVLALPEGFPRKALPEVVGAAMRAARLEVGTNAAHKRSGQSLAGMRAANESQVRYQGADQVYAVRDRDVREWTVRESMDAIQRTLVRLEPDQVREACETLKPLVVTLLDKGVIQGTTERERGRANLAAQILDHASRKVLRDLGTVAGSKASRMKPTKPVPSSGTASRAVVIGDPGGGRCWEVHPNRYELVPLSTALQHLFGTDTLPAYRAGYEVLRREQSDDTLADMKRAVVKPGRNSGKQKGRVGGPMIVRGGRP